MRKREIDKLRQEYNELKMRNFKKKAPANIGVETLKKEGPSINQNKRVQCNLMYISDYT